MAAPTASRLARFGWRTRALGPSCLPLPLPPAVPVTVVDAGDVAAAVGPLAPEAGFAVGLTCVIRDPVDVADTLGAAALVGETARLEAVGLDGATEADAGLAAGAVD